VTLKELREAYGKKVVELGAVAKEFREELAKGDAMKPERRNELKEKFEAIENEILLLRSELESEYARTPSQETIRQAQRDGTLNNLPPTLQDLLQGGQQDQWGGGHRFQDMATGREVRALLPNESVSTRLIRERPDEFEGTQDLRIGRCLQAILTGRPDVLNEAERRALFSSIDAGGGYLLTPTLSARFIDLARSASVVTRAGAQTIPMEGNELNLGRLSADPVSYWRHEGVAVTGTDISLERITLRPKTLACIIPVPIELGEDAVNISAILEGAIRASMGLKIDQAALMGKGAEAEPKGIRYHGDVNEIASIGAAYGFDNISSAVGDVMGANFPDPVQQLAWIQPPRDAEFVDKMRDGESQPIQPSPWVAALQRYMTTSLPITEGVGTNESVNIVGDFRQVVIGMRTSGVVIRVLDAGTVIDSLGITHNAASELKRLIVAYLRADIALLRPTWFVRLLGITVT
jgi:HK97 family phage major capsid protein